MIRNASVFGSLFFFNVIFFLTPLKREAEYSMITHFYAVASSCMLGVSNVVFLLQMDVEPKRVKWVGHWACLAPLLIFI